MGMAKSLRGSGEGAIEGKAERVNLSGRKFDTPSRGSKVGGGSWMGSVMGPAVTNGVLSLEHIAGITEGSLLSVLWEGAFSPCILVFCWDDGAVKISWGLQ
jgi:hypothetical protein